MLVRGIVRSLLVLGMFVLGGGEGGSVAIGRYRLFGLVTVVGIGVFVCVANVLLLYICRGLLVAFRSLRTCTK